MSEFYRRVSTLMMLPWTVGWPVFTWWTDLLDQYTQLNLVRTLGHLDSYIFWLEKHLQGLRIWFGNRTHTIEAPLGQTEYWIDSMGTHTELLIEQSKNKNSTTKHLYMGRTATSTMSTSTSHLLCNEPAVHGLVQVDTAEKSSVYLNTFASVINDDVADAAPTIPPIPSLHQTTPVFELLDDPDYPIDVIADAQRWLKEHSDDEWKQDQEPRLSPLPEYEGEYGDYYEDNLKTDTWPLPMTDTQQDNTATDNWMDHEMSSLSNTMTMPGRGYYPIEVPLRIQLGRQLIQQKIAI